MSLLIFILLSAADVESLLTAKSSQDIESHHRETTQLSILKERCEIEIRKKWIPLFCFEWLSKSPMPPKEKRAYEDYFHQKCVSAVADESVGAWKAFRSFKRKSGPCFEAVLQKYRDHLYQGQKSALFLEMAQMIQLGRDFELSSGHEDQKAPKSERLRNHQLHR